MTKITIHWQKMQFHKIPKCRVSFMTWSWAFSIYDNNWIPVDWTSIEVPVWTILSYVSWVQWTVYQFNIWNIPYAVYERNWYSWTTKYLEWIIIDWTAFTKWTHTIAWDTEINALWIRNGISITFDLSPNPWLPPPPAPILYPSWVLVNKVTLNYDWYAAIISFDEWESILVPEQQWYEATWASVPSWTALYADTTITIYLQQLVTCDLVPYSQAQIQSPSDITAAAQYAIYQNYPLFQIQQWRSPSAFNYIFYDWRNRYWIWRVIWQYPWQNPWEMRNWEVIVPFFYDWYNTYSTPFDYQWWAMWQLPYWQSKYPLNQSLLDEIFYKWYSSALAQIEAQWGASDVCDLWTIIYSLATNK